MYEEQHMMSKGVPFSEAVLLCNSMRRDIALGRLGNENNSRKHICKCGGAGNCPDCPNKNR